MNISLVWDQSVLNMAAGERASFEAAVTYVANFYDSLLTSPYTVTINVGWGEITQGSSTSTLSGGGAEGGPDDLYPYTYQEVASALKAHANSLATLSAYANLPSSDPTGGGGVYLTTMQAEALGLDTFGEDVGSGSIGFAADGDYNFSTTDRAVSGEADFVGIVEHEMSHALGRLSLLDVEPGVSLMDLVRFTSSGTLASSSEQNSYFSIDGGATVLDDFATAASDPGDWSNSGSAATPHDSYNAYYGFGVEDPVTAIDEELMNVIGFSLSATSGSGGNVASGETLLVSAGAVFTATIVASGGAISVLSSGTTSQTVISAGGSETVSAGGTAENTVVDGGSVIVSSGGSAVATTVSSGGVQSIEADGSASDSVVSAGGRQVLASGGMVSGTMLLSGATEFLSHGAIVSGLDPAAGAIIDLFFQSATAIGLSGPDELVATSSGVTVATIGLASGTHGLRYSLAPDGVAGTDIIVGSAVAADDSNGDGASDILLQNASSGRLYVYEMNGTTVTSGGSPGTPSAGWSVVGTGDFNGDGKSDILFQNSASTRLYEYQMNGAQLSSGVAVSLTPGTGWTVVGTGDFNGDGDSDILLQNTSTTRLYVYEMNGASVISGGSPATPGDGWKVVGTGDFNGDGKADILFQNTSTSRLYEYFMNGTQLSSGASVNLIPGVGWNVVGVGDFNGDGKADILLQNSSSSRMYIYEMNGATVVSGGSPFTPAAGWSVVGTGDYNGDGKADILFQNNSSTRLYEYQMNGLTVASAGSVSLIPGAGWGVLDH
jgi:autotransporter passenger strand-loop-strand repeat protein